MKNNRFARVLALLFVFLLAAALFTGCAAKSAAPSRNESVTYDSAMPQEAPAPQAAPAGTAAPAAENAASGGVGKGGASNIPTEDRKIIRNAWLTIETKNFSTDIASIEQRIAAIGGYVQSSYVSGREPKEWNDSGRNATISARVPADKLDAFLSDVKSIGEVIEQNTGSDDVTMQYFDTESHVSVLKVQLERLKSILASSDKLADVLALETEIARIQYEIEQLTTDLRRWDNLVTYSTVEIRLIEVTQLQRPVYAETDLGERLRDAFNRSISSTVDFFEGALVVLVSLLPALVILAVIAIVVWLIVRASQKARKRREAAAGKTDDKPPEKAFK